MPRSVTYSTSVVQCSNNNLHFERLKNMPNVDAIFASHYCLLVMSHRLQEAHKLSAQLRSHSSSPFPGSKHASWTAPRTSSIASSIAKQECLSGTLLANTASRFKQTWQPTLYFYVTTGREVQSSLETNKRLWHTFRMNSTKQHYSVGWREGTYRVDRS